MTGPAFDLRLPPAVPLSAKEELAIAEATARAGATTRRQSLRLGFLLKAMDRAEAAMAILEDDMFANDFDALMMRSDLHLARHCPQDDAVAHGLLRHAVELAPDTARKAWALAELGRAATHMGDRVSAREFLSRALGYNPVNADAFRRLAQLALDDGRHADALALADGMLAAQARQTWATAIRAAALLGQGETKAAQDMLGLHRFSQTGMLPVPAGWPSIAAFNRAVAAELEIHPGLRYERYGTAAMASWRVDEPHLHNRSPLFAQLLAALRDVVRSYVHDLDSGGDHPFLRSRPAVAELHSWAVMASPAGYEAWHLHPGGWLSGVYYVDVPASVEMANDHGGCLEFGVTPADGAGASSGLGQLVRPRPGLFMMFPSGNYHRTHPMNQDGRRICVAFDVVPVSPTPGRA